MPKVVPSVVVARKLTSSSDIAERVTMKGTGAPSLTATIRGWILRFGSLSVMVPMAVLAPAGMDTPVGADRVRVKVSSPSPPTLSLTVNTLTVTMVSPAGIV